MAVDHRDGVSALWAHDGLRHLLVGQTVSALGDWMGTVALMALVLQLTGSSSAVAVILVLRLAPAALAGPLAPRLASRYDRRRTMLAMDAARAGMVLLIPFVWAVWWVYLWAFLVEMCGLVFLPARDALIPELASGGDVRLADGLVLGTSYGTIPFGALLFAAVSAVAGTHRWGMVLVFSVDAATFLVSFAEITRVRIAGRAARKEAHEQPARFIDAVKLPIVRAVAAPAFVAALGLGALFSLGIVFVRKVLGASNTEFAVLVALFGVGAAIGLAVLRSLKLEGPPVVLGALALQGADIAGMSLAPDIWLAFLGAVGFGALTAAGLAAAMSVLQERLEGNQRVTAFAAFHVMIRTGLALAAVGAGAAADAVAAVRWPLVGRLPATRVVLLVSGLVIIGGAALGQRAMRELGPRRSSVGG